MKLKIALSWFFIVIILVFSVASKSNYSSSVQIPLQQWNFYAQVFPDTLTASVPGCIHLDLLKNKILEEPFDGMNESKYQWIDTIEWIYETTFEIEKSQFNNFQHKELVFEGIDTHAEIFLNDKRIAFVNNMYRKWVFDVSESLLIGTNKIKIKFKPAKLINKNEAAKLAYQLPDERVFSRKAPYHFG